MSYRPSGPSYLLDSHHSLPYRTSSSDSDAIVPPERKVGFELFFQTINVDFNRPTFTSTISTSNSALTTDATFIEKLQNFSNSNFKVNDMGLVASTFKFSAHLAIYTVSLVAIKAIANSLSWIGIACVVAGYFALSEEITSSITEKARSLLAALQLDNNLLEDFPIQITPGSALNQAWTELAAYINESFSSQRSTLIDTANSHDGMTSARVPHSTLYDSDDDKPSLAAAIARPRERTGLRSIAHASYLGTSSNPYAHAGTTGLTYPNHGTPSGLGFSTNGQGSSIHRAATASSGSDEEW